MNLGLAIAVLRTNKNYTQEEFGKRSRLSATGIGRIESGERYPRMETLKKLAKGLDLPLPMLFIAAIENNDFKNFKPSTEISFIIQNKLKKFI
jgi:transcriptional regulator with XRE-family HTH domain